MNLLDVVNRILIRLPPTGELIASILLYLLLLTGSAAAAAWAIAHLRIVIV